MYEGGGVVDRQEDNSVMHTWLFGATDAEDPPSSENALDTAPVKTGRKRLAMKNSETGSIDMAFDQWWREYPRKVGKLSARKAYGKAVKMATPSDLLQGLTRWASDPLNRGALADGQYCPHPATWLNQGRWMDETTTGTISRTRHWRDRCLHEPVCQNATSCDNLQRIAAWRRDHE